MNHTAITSYEIGEDYIKIQFESGRIYKYSYRSATEKHVESMKSLARAGNGLEEYIARKVDRKVQKHPESVFRKLVKFFRR